jgi:hypothetical protein
MELSKRNFQIVVVPIKDGKTQPNSKTISLRETDFDGSLDDLVNLITEAIRNYRKRQH